MRIDLQLLVNLLLRKYKNIFEVSYFLAYLYINSHCNLKECDLIKEIAIEDLAFEILPKIHLNHVYKSINFKKELEQVNINLLPLKQKIFNQWKNNEFPSKVRKLVARDDKWGNVKELKFQFMKDHLYYEADGEKEVKKELGLV